MEALCSALDNAADGALIIDASQTILYANEAAQRLLRFNFKRDKKERCYQLLRGRDSERRWLCEQNCSVLQRCLGGEAVQNFDVQIDMKANGFQWFNVSVLHYVGRADGQLYIVHLLREILHKDEGGWDLEQVRPGNGNQSEQHAEIRGQDDALRRFIDLTERERQVLACLIRGEGTEQISAELSVSVHTTRNHVQHILQKLGVHSRAEAVAYVHQHDLFDRWRRTRWW